MFGIIASIITVIAGSVVWQIVAGSILAVIVAFWDKFGKDILQYLAAVVCLCGIFYLAFAATITAGDVIITVGAGLLAGDKLAKLIGDVLDMAFMAVGAVIKAVGKALPAWMWVAGAAAVYLSLSSDDVPPANVNLTTVDSKEG